MQQFAPPIGKCSVRCWVEVSKYEKIQPCVEPERISVFLDPRREKMSEDDCIGSGNVF